MSIKTDSLAYYYQLMDLRADGFYQEILIKLKHADDRIAPSSLRYFFEKTEPQRLSYIQGVDNQDGKLSFWWFFSEYAVKGEADAFSTSIEQFMKEQGFILCDSLAEEADQLCYTMIEDGLTYTFRIESPESYTGGPLCGSSILYEVVINSILSEPQIQNITKLYPAVYCNVLPMKVEKEIKKRQFVSISYGGTWEHYYTWNVDIKCLDDIEAGMLLKELSKLVLSAGYRFQEESGATRSFILRDFTNPAYIYLTKQDDSNIVTLRFQPNS